MENKNKPSFPQNEYSEHNFNVAGGLTKREYIAGLAMQGILASRVRIDTDDLSEKNICRRSVEFADLLLKQLEEK